MIAAQHDALKRRFDMMLARGTVVSADSGPKLQTIDARLMAGERPTKLEHFESYGFTARPHEGAEVVAGFVGGNRDHGFVIAYGDRRYRMQGLAGGEVALHDDQGQSIHMKRDGMVIKSGKPVTIEAPQIVLKGAIQITGDITQTGAIQSTGVHKAAGHT